MMYIFKKNAMYGSKNCIIIVKFIQILFDSKDILKKENLEVYLCIHNPSENLKGHKDTDWDPIEFVKCLEDHVSVRTKQHWIEPSKNKQDWYENG